MYEFQYDNVKPKYGEKAELCYWDTDIVYIKTDGIYNDIAHAEVRFDTSNLNQTDLFLKEKIRKYLVQ